MSKKDEYALVGKAMMEPTFRKRLLDNPTEAIKAEGLDVSPAVRDQLTQIDRAVADQVSSLISSVFGQGELSDRDLDAVAGGAGPVQATATPQVASPKVTAPNVQVINRGQIDPAAAKARAPTTW
jgi:hypothetical protein